MSERLSTKPPGKMAENGEPVILAAVRTLNDALRSPLELTDLGRLARMHTACESILSDETGGAPPATRKLACGIARLLEAVILAEAAHPAAALEQVPVAVAHVETTLRGEEVDSEPLLATLAWCITGEGAAPAVDALRSLEPPAGAGPQRDLGEAACTGAAPSCPGEAAGAFVADDDSTGAAESVECAATGAISDDFVSEPLRYNAEEREHLAGFLDESVEHLDAIEAALLEVEESPADTGKINELFRPFHTIKGIAGFLNLRDINRLTHEVETILDLARKSELTITSGTIDLIFSAIDMLNAQIGAVRDFISRPTAEGVIPQPDIRCIMGRLRAAAAGQLPPASERPRAQSGARVGEILVAERATQPEVVDLALARQAMGDDPRKVGQILSDMGVVSKRQVGEALNQQAAAAESVGGSKGSDPSIRVDTRKLDLLVDAVGELVIAQTMVNLSGAVRTDAKLSRDVAQVSKIVRDVQETAMAMRMIPIGGTFQKMRRLVRDVARKANKEVELWITGEETELDKNVIQQISDPLVHMVRNAVDHGVESPEDRAAAGKPRTGNVHLSAYHQGDSIVIEIRDDGRGLDPEVLLAKGIERGLVGSDEPLSESQIFALVFHSGFSTARTITDISGRGVGMDVVKRNIEQLRGKIEISSEKGAGSTFRIKLPLTLAIIDGMLVRVGQERMVIPTILIDQSLRPEPRQLTVVQGRCEMIQVRGQLCPLIQLGEVFGYSGRIDPCASLVVIAQAGENNIGLVVSELIGQQQVVIKTLGERFKQVRGVSGAAILGDGRVGLILEPSGLLALYRATHSRVPDRTRAQAVSTAAGAPPDPGPLIDAARASETDLQTAAASF